MTVAVAPLAGLLPGNAGALGHQEFLAVALAGMSPSLGGTFGLAQPQIP